MSVTYRRRIGDAVRWVSTNAQVLPDPDTGDLIAFFFTRDINDEVVYQKMLEDTAYKNYVAASYYDMQTDMLHTKSDDSIIKKVFSQEPYKTAVDRSIDMAVVPEEAEEIKKKFLIENIVSQLENNPVYSFYYTDKRKAEGLPGCPNVRMKNDCFYLDEHRDVIVFLLSDVTEIFEHERDQREQLSRALHEAKRANAAKTEFLSRISHDIRTPISIISSMTNFAFEDAGDREKLTEDLTKIKASTSFLLSLINDVLDISKIDSGKTELHPEPYPFEEYIAVMRGMFEPACQQKGLKFSVSMKSAATGCILADKIRINQIVLNIISNAVKYTPAGGTVTYTSKSRNMPDGKILYAFEVSDTGIGMSEEFQKNLFKPFTQEFDNPERAKAETGTGLGLAIVKRMVDLMGGEITVKSELGKGTVISVNIVFPNANADPNYIKHEEQKKQKHERSMLKGKILLAEDNEINTEIAQRIIRKFGLDVTAVRNGAEAVEMFENSQRGEFSAILMDIQMPVVNGYEAAEKIRCSKRPDAQTIPIIAMTADAFAEAVERCKVCGMNGHLTKPIDPDMLYETLDRSINDK
jgi:signal transduction histidine kinase/ActR/RegA family two-component response regulator